MTGWADPCTGRHSFSLHTKSHTLQKQHNEKPDFTMLLRHAREFSNHSLSILGNYFQISENKCMVNQINMESEMPGNAGHSLYINSVSEQSRNPFSDQSRQCMRFFAEDIIPCDIFSGNEQTDSAVAARMLRIRFRVRFIVTSFGLGLVSVLIMNHFYYN